VTSLCLDILYLYLIETIRSTVYRHTTCLEVHEEQVKLYIDLRSN